MSSDSLGAIVRWIDRPATTGPLAGLRVGVKDLLAVEGVPRLCGAEGIVDDRPQDADADAVGQLAAAGAAIVATTATHQLGFGVTTPGTVNPRIPERIAGGSSGGAGAALAAGLIEGALASDSAGSIRIPAACCGVVGFKPTEGVVSRDGLAPLAPTFDTVGPMARDVATAVALYGALSAFTRQTPPDDAVRIGVIADALNDPLDGAVRRTWEAVLGLLRDAGAVLVDVTVPLWAEAHRAHGRILAAEALRIHAATLRDHGDRLDADVRRGLDAAGHLSQDKVLEARRSAAIFRDRLQAVFSDADVLVLPALPCTVPHVGADTIAVDGRTERVVSALTRLTDPWNLGGVPAGVVPVGRDPQGGPIGMQVVGPWQADATVLSAMAQLERLVGGPWPPVARPAHA